MPNFFCIAEGRIDMGDAFLTDIDPTSTTSVVSRRPTVGRDRSANLLQHSFWQMSARARLQLGELFGLVVENATCDYTPKARKSFS